MIADFSAWLNLDERFEIVRCDGAGVAEEVQAD